MATASAAENGVGPTKTAAQTTELKPHPAVDIRVLLTLTKKADKMTIKQSRKLRELALLVTKGALRRPWNIQTSNSFRRIGTDRGDGDVLCTVKQRSDGHPDLHAAPNVLDYIIAAHPLVVLELLNQLDRTQRAIDHLRHEIDGHESAFSEAEAIRLGGVQ
jgi:hypothetical protein